ncbi:hypothetical protein BJ165DRAFT_1409206 [Panaeolus papilionaceus]|nr:hypothetical protein BJ165DRAFT_1409206 [Panaeolus papilionaceus]
MDSVIIEDVEGMGVRLNGNWDVGEGGGQRQMSWSQMAMNAAASSNPVPVIPGAAFSSSNAASASSNGATTANANSTSNSSRLRSKPRPWDVLPHTRPSMDATTAGAGLSTIPEGQGLGKPLVPQKAYKPSPYESYSIFGACRTISDDTYEFNRPDQSDESSVTYGDAAAEEVHAGGRRAGELADEQ